MRRLWLMAYLVAALSSGALGGWAEWRFGPASILWTLPAALALGVVVGLAAVWAERRVRNDGGQPR